MSRVWPFLSLLLIVLAFIVGLIVGSSGESEASANYYEKAAEQYQIALQVDTPPAGADEPERWEKAIALYRSVFDNYPDSEYADDALFAIASRIDYKKQPDIALTLYRRLINDYPDSEHAPPALNAVGVAHFHREDYDRAMYMFDQFLEAYPTSPLRNEAMLNRAVCLMKKGKFDESRAELEKLADAADFEHAAQFYTAMVHYEQQAFPDARKHFGNVIDSGNPDFAAEAQFNIAQSYFSERAYEDAIASYEETIQNYPDSASAVDSAFQIGWSYERIKEYQAAVDALKTAIEAHPNSRHTPSAQVFMAKIHSEALDQPEEAVDAYRAIVNETIPLAAAETEDRAIYDIRRNAQYQIAHILEKEGDSRAIEEYKTMLEMFPEPHAAPEHKSNEIDETYIHDLRLKLSE